MSAPADAIALLRTLSRARLIAPLRPDRYLRMATAIRREGMTPTVGFAVAAARCPDRPALIDELGTLSWQQLHQRCDEVGAGLQSLPAGTPTCIAIMCRNHRGFVQALVAAHRIGADLVLMNTSFAGPALADVIDREGVDTVIYDEEFTDTVDRALSGRPHVTRILAWNENQRATTHLTLGNLADAHDGRQPIRSPHTSRLVLLTSGTTGAPKGARPSSGGGAAELKAVLDRTPWRAEETTVVLAPMFHAWGFSQLVFSALMACTIVTRRRFDPEAVLRLVDRHRASGLVVVPVMLERIMDLSDDIRRRYRRRWLRFATASGSRMRPDAVIKFMDQFGDVVYNNYNATEVGMVAAATPADLRAAPTTAGKPLPGTDVRILDDAYKQLAAGQTGRIFVRSRTLFDGYTSGPGKTVHDGFMASGDVGYVDAEGRLFVVGRDDEMIVSGGENIYPLEVEMALMQHPDVNEVAVIGVDDNQYGQALAAFVVLRAGAAATSDTLRSYVRENLAGYKVPRVITILEELPRGGTGKVLRQELRARLGAER
jgi:acyl-CoA synthetase (AMP-forming)/AMP-acid ligase II